MYNIYGIILAGGQGRRIGRETPKQFLNIDDRPVIIHTLEKFNLPQISGIIIVTPEDYIEYANKLVKDFSIEKVINIIKGGETRQGSSYNAIKCMDYKDNDVLVFHDAARPFIARDTIDMCIKEAGINGASGVYIKATDTIAGIENGFVQNIPSRERLYYTQTPQSFKYRIIRDAHELALSKGIDNLTDDVQLVIDASYKVKMVPGDYKNIKITTPLDLDFARFISNREGG